MGQKKAKYRTSVGGGAILRRRKTKVENTNRDGNGGKKAQESRQQQPTADTAADIKAVAARPGSSPSVHVPIEASSDDEARKRHPVEPSSDDEARESSHEFAFGVNGDTNCNNQSAGHKTRLQASKESCSKLCKTYKLFIIGFIVGFSFFPIGIALGFIKNSSKTCEVCSEKINVPVKPNTYHDHDNDHHEYCHNAIYLEKCISEPLSDEIAQTVCMELKSSLINDQSHSASQMKEKCLRMLGGNYARLVCPYFNSSDTNFDTSGILSGLVDLIDSMFPQSKRNTAKDLVLCSSHLQSRLCGNMTAKATTDASSSKFLDGWTLISPCPQKNSRCCQNSRCCAAFSLQLQIGTGIIPILPGEINHNGKYIPFCK